MDFHLDLLKLKWQIKKSTFVEGYECYGINELNKINWMLFALTIDPSAYLNISIKVCMERKFDFTA